MHTAHTANWPLLQVQMLLYLQATSLCASCVNPSQSQPLVHPHSPDCFRADLFPSNCPYSPCCVRFRTTQLFPLLFHPAFPIKPTSRTSLSSLVLPPPFLSTVAPFIFLSSPSHPGSPVGAERWLACVCFGLAVCFSNEAETQGVSLLWRWRGGRWRQAKRWQNLTNRASRSSSFLSPAFTFYLSITCESSFSMQERNDRDDMC